MRLIPSRRRTVALAAAGVAVTLVAAIPIAANGLSSDPTRSARKALVGGTARNVILLIGDGMGDSEITAARNYEVGAAGRLALDRLPLTGAYTTYSVDKATGKPDYVPDSAATGTAWATGYKTYDNAVSVTRDGKPKATVLELAQKAGYRVGNVTTSEVQDATPAVLAAHISNRGCYGPSDTSTECPAEAKENGGLGSITEQHLDQKADILLGGGSAPFTETIKAGTDKGRTGLQAADRIGYRVVDTAAELAALNPKSKAPIIGLFGEGNLVVERVGPTPTRTNTPASTCTANPAYPAAQPRLVDMTKKSLQVLDTRSKNTKKGFFLQVEGASIDKRDHAADPCGQIGENIAFDRAVQAALDYQKRHPRTLVVVTADHGHTSQIVEAGSTTQGFTATLTTKDGSPMTISYATADIAGSQQHTGVQVRIAAKGPQAAGVLGVTDQTELNTTLRRALGLAG